MNSQVETLKGLERALTVTVAATKIDQEVAKRLVKAKDQVRIDGFSPGRVPMAILKKRFGSSVRQEVLGEIIQESFYEAIKKEKVNPAGMPKIDITKDQEGQDLEFKAVFEIFPEIAITGLDKIKVDKPIAEVMDKDLDAMLENLKKQNLTWEAVKRAAKSEDQVTVDFEGFMGGEKFEGGSAENVPLVLGSGRMIPGFEEGLVGAKVGEKRELNLAFPKDYHVADMAGKKAMFKVTVKEVQAPKLPEFDEEFLKRFGVDSLDKLKQEVRQNMERELEFGVKNNIKQQVMDGLLKENTIDVPKALVDQEMVQLKEQALKQMGFNPSSSKQKMPPLPDEGFVDQATRRVSLALLVSKLIEQMELKPEESKVKALIEKMASVYETPEEVVKHYYRDEQQMAEIRQVVMEEQVVDKILQSATVKDKKMSFKEAIGQAESEPDKKAKKSAKSKK